jgi:hypothetical protein
MVGHYQVFISEDSELRKPNDVNLSLTIGVTGVNSQSPHYDSGMSERLVRVSCNIPEQDFEESRLLNIIFMYSVLGGEYEPQYGRWYLFRTLLTVEFTIILLGLETQVTFTLETETDVTDLETNSSDHTTITESVSFDYRIQTNYTNTLMPTMLMTGGYISGIGITVFIIAMAAKRIVPDESECSSMSHGLYANG